MKAVRGDIALRRAAFVAVALLVALALKLHHRRADAEDLRWVLAPTTAVVERMTGADFEYEPHRGYLSREHRYEIVPACAGVNFMVVALVSVTLALACSSRMPGVLFPVPVATAAAYAFTIAANGTRIALAMRLHEAQAAFGPLTPERLHRLVGALVYFTFLIVLYRLAQRLVEARDGRTA